MQTRNAASVLPEPVGAAIRVSRPAAIWAQPPAWGSVGPAWKRRSNQARTAGWKGAAAGIAEQLYAHSPSPGTGRASVSHQRGQRDVVDARLAEHAPAVLLEEPPGR